MASFSSLGIGSGLELSSLVDNLLAAERAPVENSIARQQSRLTTELSGVGIFRGAISSFRSSLTGLDELENYSTKAYTNNNSSAISVAITNDAAVGSYDIDVTNLAEKHSVASASFAELTDEIGTGTIQIKFGTITGPGFSSFAADAGSTVQTLTIDSTNNTLDGLRNYINEGDFGVNAAIINDGSGYRLTLTSEESGANAGMEISVTDTGDANDTDNNGLSQFAFNASATNLVETQAAEDAALTVNGISVVSSSNSIDTMIEGASLTLLSQTDGDSFNVTVTENTASISEAINTVIDGYNTMITTLNGLSEVGTDTSSSGVLVGDSVLRNFTSQARSLMTGAVSGLTGAVTALSTIGIKTSSDGTLSIDDSIFNEAIADNLIDTLALFAQIGKTDDSGIEFNSHSIDSDAGSYDINITQLATRSQLTGSTGLSLPITIDDDNDNISFYIDGVSTGSLSLTQGSYTTGTDLAAELQLQINSADNLKNDGLTVAVTYDTVNDGFVITSGQYGSESIVEITSVDTNTTSSLGLLIGTAAAGQDVAGTIGGHAATGTGQTLVGIAGDATDLSIEVTSGATGSRGTLQFTRGLVESLDDLLENYLSSSGVLSAKEDGINDSLELLQDEQEDLDIRLEAMETRLVNQFAALDVLLAQFQTTGTFLTQQIDSLPGFNTDS